MEENILKESGEKGLKEETLEICPRKEGPANDSKRDLTDTEKRQVNNDKGRDV